MQSIHDLLSHKTRMSAAVHLQKGLIVVGRQVWKPTLGERWPGTMIGEYASEQLAEAAARQMLSKPEVDDE